MNWRGAARRSTSSRTSPATSLTDTIGATLSQDKPLLPAPHQVASEFWNTVVDQAVTSKRSLVYHGWITLSATLLGFVFGTALGIVLAVLIVHNDATDRSLMPWIIASQTIPILAIAPMIIVVLNAVGIAGLLPKALISTYLSFFPVVVGMVKGFRSPEQIQLDLMHTYNASRWQIFSKLRWPIALPYLFASMKVGVAASLVGAIVGELPTGGGRARRAAARRLLLRPDHPDLVGAGGRRDPGRRRWSSLVGVVERLVRRAAWGRDRHERGCNASSPSSLCGLGAVLAVVAAVRRCAATPWLDGWSQRAGAALCGAGRWRRWRCSGCSCRRRRRAARALSAASSPSSRSAASSGARGASGAAGDRLAARLAVRRAAGATLAARRDAASPLAAAARSR